MKSEKINKKKKILWLVVALTIGLVIAMIIMTVAIYFGFSTAYSLGTSNYSVKILGLKIYELSKVRDTYTGTSVGVNMGIFCMGCMALTSIIEQIIVRLRQR